MAKTPKIKGSSVMGADGRSYMNPAHYGFPDPGGAAARILDRILQIKVRRELFSREIAGKREKIKELRACANRRVAYVARSSKKAIESLLPLSSTKSCQPIGAAS
jgi:hypothetical protein